MKKLFILLASVSLVACSTMNNCSSSYGDQSTTCKVSQSTDRAMESASNNVIYSITSNITSTINNAISNILR